jgi:glycosyltransferase involved in cell wall biosynthesis
MMAKPLQDLKVAIVHEWLIDYSGSERVVEQLLQCFPQADLFSVVDFLEEHQRGFLGGRKATTTFIQNLPRAKKSFRSYLPLMPMAIEQLDMSGYDLVISSAHAVSKGVLTGPDQVHISYVHSPIRYAWDLQHQYLRESGLTTGFKAKLARAILHYMRLWDTRTANGVDVFVANSGFIGRRIRKAYRRDSQVIYPPVATDKFHLREDKEDFYLTASRMVPYKMVPLIVEAFAKMPDKKLVVIGDGSEYERAVAAAGPNVSFLGYQTFDVLHDHMQRAKAFVFAAEEDFGITPVEAQACGTPVIAYGRGGALETVRDLSTSAPTGLFFESQTVDGIVKAVRTFESDGARCTPANCRANAETFSEAHFRQQIQDLVVATMAESDVPD